MSPEYNFSFIHAADESQSGSGTVFASTNGLLGLVLIGTAALWYFNRKK
jgi:L-serine deaminase